jgi:hypothetical protein
MILGLNLFRILSTSITTDNFSQSSAFPSSPPRTSLINTNDGFEQRPKSMTIALTHQENIPSVSVHPRSLTISGESMINRLMIKFHQLFFV